MAGVLSGGVKRVITAFFLVPAVIFVVAYSAPFWLLAGVSAVILLALSEYNNLSVLPARSPAGDRLCVAAGAAMPSVFFFLGAGALMPAALSAVFAFFLHGLWGGAEFKDASYGACFRTLGVLYIAIPLSYLIFLRDMENGRWWILFIFAVIWANDTFAYIVGKSVGRHKLAPRVSPGKTVEGAVGGLAAGAALSFFYDRYMGLGAGAMGIVLLALVIGVVGIAGDLAESLLKRGAGIKDSGTLIPGHGGVLDRIDSLIFPIPAVYYILIWQLHIKAAG
ncbi:MAG: phosphatidate cytidylyltransferase [Deltaproteobacteria bacterium]|nr:phosphatidate cytidylyltransferase [Deltaproteobacteria bacterium]